MPVPKVPPYDHDHENEVTLFAMTNFRNQRRKFGIKTDDRRRHTYVIGKTGMGKTTLLENMVLSDIYAGHGLAYVDPHGDTAQKILDYIPPHRINDVVYFNPSDMAFPIGFNILETVDESHKHLVAAGLMGVFKKIWPDVWSARMEYILLNTILALLDSPGSTLLGINRLLVDPEYRDEVVGRIQDPVVKTFWVKEFAAFSEKYRTEAIAPVQNKVGQFLSASIIRNIVAQVKSTVSMRDIMDTRKIFIINLAKGLIGEENSRLLGAMIITRLQLAAMERVDIPNEADRQDFYLYVDEFQNFATESFANILSEARKYRLNLVVAHQYIEQLDETVQAAIFGNVGTLIAFRVGAPDSAVLETEFTPRFLPEDLVNLAKYDIYLKLMIDGAASEPFSATTLPPIAMRTDSLAKVVKVSRERYAVPRKEIEDKVLRWSGVGTSDAGATVTTEEEEGELREKLEQLAASSPNIAAPPPAADKKKKPKFTVPCAVCGKPQELTFEPDWRRPWFCKEDMEKRKELSDQGLPLPPIRFTPTPPGGVVEGSSVQVVEGSGTTPVASAPPVPVSLSSLVTPPGQTLSPARPVARPVPRPPVQSRVAGPLKKVEPRPSVSRQGRDSQVRPARTNAPRVSDARPVLKVADDVKSISLSVLAATAEHHKKEEAETDDTEETIAPEAAPRGQGVKGGAESRRAASRGQGGRRGEPSAPPAPSARRPSSPPSNPTRSDDPKSMKPGEVVKF